MRTNVASPALARRTHEGAPAARETAWEELRRSVLACLLWEDNFYESGEEIGERILRLAGTVDAGLVADLAVQARTAYKLRHAPLLLCVALARGRRLRASTLAEVIQRPDEMGEFLSLFWGATDRRRSRNRSVPRQIRLGLAWAFRKFDAYQLAKYDRDVGIKLRDVLFLCHAKPKDPAQADLWKRLIDGRLQAADTWEVALSGGAAKRETWTRLLTENKLGDLALLRNLRNMTEARVDRALIEQALDRARFARVLPFRFISAAQAAPGLERALDGAMLRGMSQMPRLPGRTLLVVDVSGSMYGGPVSQNSDLNRAYAACALAALVRGVCEEPIIYATAGNDHTRVHQTAQVPAREGMALVDAIYSMCRPLGGGGIFLTPVCRWLRERESDIDRMIVITDEQDCALDERDSPLHAEPLGRRNYMLNVSSYDRTIAAHGRWLKVTGFSEAVIDYIRAAEVD